LAQFRLGFRLAALVAVATLATMPLAHSVAVNFFGLPGRGGVP
jgi:hypothetical protein